MVAVNDPASYTWGEDRGPVDHSSDSKRTGRWQHLQVQMSEESKLLVFQLLIQLNGP